MVDSHPDQQKRSENNSYNKEQRREYSHGNLHHHDRETCALVAGAALGIEEVAYSFNGPKENDRIWQIVAEKQLDYVQLYVLLDREVLGQD